MTSEEQNKVKRMKRTEYSLICPLQVTENVSENIKTSLYKFIFGVKFRIT